MQATWIIIAFRVNRRVKKKNQNVSIHHCVIFLFSFCWNWNNLDRELNGTLLTFWNIVKKKFSSLEVQTIVRRKKKKKEIYVSFIRLNRILAVVSFFLESSSSSIELFKIRLSASAITSHGSI